MNFIVQLNSIESTSYNLALDAIRNPVDACEELYQKIVILTKQITELGRLKRNVRVLCKKLQNHIFTLAENLYLSESYELMLARWMKLEKVK